MPGRYHNQPTETLFKQLAALTDQTANSVKAAAEILVELKARGENHPFMHEGVLRWYAQIADGRLSAKAALAFAGVNSILKHLVGMPLKQQDAFAAGQPTVIARHNTQGKIVSDERPLLQLSSNQLDLAFDQNTPRPFAAQAKILAARGPEYPERRRSQSPLSIRADIAAGEIICGQLRFTPQQLADALQRLGYRLTKMRASANV